MLLQARQGKRPAGDADHRRRPQRARSARAPGGAKGSRRRRASRLCRSRFGFPLPAENLAGRAAARRARQRQCAPALLQSRTSSRSPGCANGATFTGQLEDAVARRQLGSGDQPAATRDDGRDRLHARSTARSSSGLLGQIAQRQERNSTRPRAIAWSPSSPARTSTSARKRRAAERSAGGEPAPKSRQPAWIMAGEIVETSQLFARTVAGINPEWVHRARRAPLPVPLHRAALERESRARARARARAGARPGDRAAARRFRPHRSGEGHRAFHPRRAGRRAKRGCRCASSRENQKVCEKIENALTRVRSRRAHDLDEVALPVLRGADRRASPPSTI